MGNATVAYSMAEAVTTLAASDMTSADRSINTDEVRSGVNNHADAAAAAAFRDDGVFPDEHSRRSTGRRRTRSRRWAGDDWVGDDDVGGRG